MNVLELSADLQCELIQVLTSESDVKKMLAAIAERIAGELNASACSIYTLDSGGHTATQRAGTGYQADFVDLAKCQVIPASQVSDDPKEHEKLGLTGWILSTGKSLLAKTPEQVMSHPHRLGIHDVKQSPHLIIRLQAFLGMPLRGPRGEVIGLIKAERLNQPIEQMKPFSVHDQIVLETGARIASKCLTYLEIAHSGDLDGAITAWTRDVIGEAATSEGELDTFLSSVVNVVAAAMGADSCGIYLTDESKKTLTQRAGCGTQEPRYVIRSYPLPPVEQIKERPTKAEKVGLTAWIAIKGQSFCANDYEELSSHAHHKGEYDSWNFPDETKTICGAFLGVPLQIGGTIRGVLKVENRSRIGELDTRKFSEAARRRFDRLAQDVALAVVRLQEERIPARYEVIRRAENTIFGILRGGSDVTLKSLVEKVVSDTGKLFNARACALFLKEGNRLIQPAWAAVGYAAKGPGGVKEENPSGADMASPANGMSPKSSGETREYTLVQPDDIKDNPGPDEKVGLTVWIAVKQKKYTARSNLELKMHPHHKGKYDDVNFKPGERCESFMGEPLIVGGKLVGVLKVETKQKVERITAPDGRVHEAAAVTYFSEQDELVFDLIANSAAIAIENARLLESQRLAEQILGRTQRLLIDLHDFVKGPWRAIETLTQASAFLEGRRPTIARIVEHYAALLQPNFSVHLLESFPGLLTQYGDFLEGSRPTVALYNALANALQVQSLPDILEALRSRDKGHDAQLLEPGFYLAEASGILVDMYREIEACLGHHNMAALRRTTLDAPTDRLKTIRIRAAGLSQPERDILIRIIDLWLHLIEITPVPEFRYVTSPYVAGPPIFPKTGNPFFGRRDVFDWVAKNLRGAHQKNNLLLLGERRMGKTSILLQLERGAFGESLRKREDHPLCPIFIDLQPMSSDGNAVLLHGIAQSVYDHLCERSSGLTDVPMFSSFAAEPYRYFHRFMEDVNQQLRGRMLLVLMLDEIEALAEGVQRGKLDTGIYGVLRHGMQFWDQVAFILAGSHRPDEMPSEYYGLFAGAVPREVSFMKVEDARALVQEPVSREVTYDKAAVDALIETTHGHPYLLQVLCHEIITQMNHRAQNNYITVEHVRHTVEHTVHEGTIHFQLMWSRCGADSQSLLAVMADIAEHEQRPCTKRELSERLHMSMHQTEVALQHLLDHHVVEFVEDDLTASIEGPKLCRPTVPIFSRWICTKTSQRG